MQVKCLPERLKSFIVGRLPEKEAIVTLLLSRLSKMLAEERRGALLQMLGADMGADGEAGVPVAVEELERECAECSRLFLDRYVLLKCGVVNALVRKSMEMHPWTKAKEVREVRFAVKELARTFLFMSDELCVVFGSPVSEGGLSRDSGFDSMKDIVQGASNQGELWNVGSRRLERMFDKRVSSRFDQIELSGASIICRIFKVCMKTWLECVRLSRFSRSGFQQMQVDCSALKVLLKSSFPEQELLSGMVEEVLGSAADRCSEVAETLSASVVASLVAP